MAYKPQTGDQVRVFVRHPFKEHIGSPMVITDVHYNGNSLHYANTVDKNGCPCEIETQMFEIKLLKKAEQRQRQNVVK